MTRLAIGKAFILGAALAALSISLSAQRSVTRSVYIDAVDSGGKPVLNLTAEDFQVTENGAKRGVVRAALGNAPMCIVRWWIPASAVAPMMSTFRHGLACVRQRAAGIGRSGLHFVRRSAPDSHLSLAPAATRCARRSRGSHRRAAPTRSTTPCSKPTNDS